jgi:DNA-binding CsgD family transcriptional regulator
MGPLRSWVFDSMVFQTRLDILLGQGRGAEVLAEAEAAHRRHVEQGMGVWGRAPLARVRAAAGRYDDAKQELLGLLAAFGDNPWHLMLLAGLEHRFGRIEAAKDALTRAGRLAESGTAPGGGAGVDTAARVSIELRRGLIAIDEGRVADAAECAHRALPLAIGQPEITALELLAEVELARGDRVLGGRLYGAAERRREEMDCWFSTGSDERRARLAEECDDVAREEGRALAWSDALALAMRGRGPHGRPRSGWESLSPVERQVAAAAAAGLTNAQIGAKLFMAVDTVKTHLSHVYAKVGIHSRRELAKVLPGTAPR